MRARRQITSALLLAFGLAFGPASAAGAAPPAAPPADDAFGESVDVNVVNVEVYVTDKQGRPVTGLKREDFDLLEDGKKVEVTNFEALTGASRPAPSSPAAPSTTTAAPAPSEPAAAPAGDPLYTVIYVDNFNIEPANRARALQQIREYLDKEMSPGDRVMVVTSDLGLQVRQPFTDDRAALGRALDEVAKSATRGAEDARAKRTALDAMFSINAEEMSGPKGGGGGGGGARGEGGEGAGGGGIPCSLRIAEPIKNYAESARHEVLSTIASLKLFVNSLSGLPGRKVLFHVSDGISITPGEELFQVLQELCGGSGVTSGYAGSQSDPGSQPVDARQFGPLAYQGSQAMLDAQRYSTAGQWTELAAHANANRVTLYTLQASGLQGHAGVGAENQGGGRDQLMRLGSVMHIETNNRRDSLNVLASDTGGRAIFNANDLRPELSRIQEDLETYYSLGFAPRRAGDGREHRLEVRVKRQDVRVRHRRSYRDKSSLERTADRTLSALFYGTQDNPLEVALEIGDIQPAEGKTFRVPIRLNIPLFKLLLQDNTKALVGKVRLLVATQNARGDTSKVRQVEVPIQIPRDKALIALGQHFQYELTLTMAGGDQRVAVAVQDVATSQVSYLSRDVQVEVAAAAR
jgi:VWFA-related protein